ncbi:MAG: ABC transporter ATP-binding protein [Thermoleophilia bacterium]|nr:ABC transporter ATP-binding protein [Thermoleophilia bacterium]
MAAPVIRAEGLTKHYGRTVGVEGLTFTVEPGEVFGYLGPNGAGKTTTIRLLLDLIRPTAGGVQLFGLDARRDSVAVHRRLGYVPGDLALYDRLTGRELLRYFASLRGLDGIAEGEAVARRLELDLDTRIRSLSKGNRQKVGLVQAFLPRPDLLVLDEPTSSLDPLVQQEVYGLIDDATGEGRTVFLSSHVLSEVQRIAHRVAVIREGELVLVEGVAELRARAFTRVEARFAEEPPADAFDGIPGVRELSRLDTTIRFALEGAPDPLVKALAGFTTTGLDVEEADLEDIFLDLYRRRASDDA